MDNYFKNLNAILNLKNNRNDSLEHLLRDDIRALKVSLDSVYSFDDILSIHPRNVDFKLIPTLKKIGIEEGGCSMSGKDLWLKTYKVSYGFIDPKAVIIKKFHMEANGSYPSDLVRDAINSYLELE